MKTFTVDGKAYEFDHHRIGYGYTTYFAISIKAHGVYGVKLPAEYQTRLDRMIQAGFVRDEWVLWNWAYEQVQENFWDWAKEQAEELGIGEVHSEGRQGGWLVAKQYSVQHLECYEDDANRAPCELCRQQRDNHIPPDRKCPFSPSLYKSSDGDAVGTFETLQTFQELIKGSISYYEKEAFLEQYMYFVDQKWDEFEETMNDRTADVVGTGDENGGCTGAEV